MGVNEFCSNGLDITTEARCNEAQLAAESMGLHPSRDVLLVGDWPGVPYRCSAQVGTDNPELKDDVHWSTNENTDNSRFITGEFRMICETGEYFLPMITCDIPLIFLVYKIFPILFFSFYFILIPINRRYNYDRRYENDNNETYG